MNSITEGKEYPKKEILEAAEEQFYPIANELYPVLRGDYETDIERNAFIKGANYAYTQGRKAGYSERSKEVREFYADVRLFMKIHRVCGGKILDDYQSLILKIDKALASFTEFEQQSLPFGE